MQCHITQSENRYADRIERRDARIDEAHEHLAKQFLAACAAPLTLVPTPGWREGGAARLIDVLADAMSGTTSDAEWAEVVSILTKSPEGNAFLKRHAESYADFHEEDLAEVM